MVVSGFYGGDGGQTLEGESGMCDTAGLRFDLEFHAPTLG